MGDEWKNYDSEGKFIPRKTWMEQKYTDYYGPMATDKHGREVGLFYHKEFTHFGHRHYFGEILIIAIFTFYILFGLYHIYYLGGALRDAYLEYASMHPIQMEFARAIWEWAAQQYTEHDVQFNLIIAIVVGSILLIYVLALAVSYLIVRIFSDIVKILMYVALFLQIGLAIYLYYKIEWEYNWTFLLIIIPNVLMLTFWRKKFGKAIRALRMGTLAVSREGWQLLGPQISQTGLLSILSVLFTATSIGSVYNLTPFSNFEVSFVIADKTITITEGYIYTLYAFLFIFCAFIVIYVSQGMKILMIHQWYRGGGRLGFWRALNIIQYRWWGILGYAFTSAIIRMLQYFRQALKGKFGPKNVKEAFSLTGELLPGKELAYKVKKGTPWYERIWMGLNTYSLPAIVIENKLFPMAILRSLYVFLHDLAQIYIKETHVRTVLVFLEYTLSTVLILLGSLLGYILGQWLGVDNWLVYLLTGSGGAFFFWVAGTTTTLIMDDVNLAYVAVLYIISIDEINMKDKYAIDYLEEIDGKPVIILDQKRHEELKADLKEAKEKTKLDKQKAKEEKKKKREGVSQEKEIDNEPIIEQQQTEEVKTVVDTSQKPPE